MFDQVRARTASPEAVRWSSALCAEHPVGEQAALRKTTVQGCSRCSGVKTLMLLTTLARESIWILKATRRVAVDSPLWEP